MKKTIIITAAFALSILSSLSTVAQRKSIKSKAVVGKSSQPKDMLVMLQGWWSLLDDKKTFFKVEGDKQVNVYGRDILDTVTLNFHSECPNRLSAEDEKRSSGKYMTAEVNGDDFYCYSIEKISPQQLTLMYLPKGSLLKYKKVAAIKLQTTSVDLED